MQRVLQASLQMAADCRGVPAAHLPWAAQLQRAMAAAGVEFDPQLQEQLSVDSVRQAALSRYLQRVAVAAQADSSPRLHHYFGIVRPGCLAVEGYGMAAYITEVRQRSWRVALAELRSGVHWGAEERDRLLGPARRPRAERHCEHCRAAGVLAVENTHHIVYDCVLYADLRLLYPELFPAALPLSSLAAILDGPPAPIASYASGARRRGRRAAGLPP